MDINEHLKKHYPADWREGEKYKYDGMLGGMLSYQGKATNIFPRIKCADGVSLSVQGHYGAYSRPRDDFAETYLLVEVGYIEDDKEEPMAPPESWREHADGDFPSSIYGYVPVRLVEEFIDAHGGVAV